MALPDGAEERVAGPVFSVAFEPGTRGVYYVQRSSNGLTLKFFQYGSRSEATIAPLGSAPVNGITISPDERFAPYSRYELTDSELMLVEGSGRKHGP